MTWYGFVRRHRLHGAKTRKRLMRTTKNVLWCSRNFSFHYLIRLLVLILVTRSFDTEGDICSHRRTSSSKVTLARNSAVDRRTSPTRTTICYRRSLSAPVSRMNAMTIADDSMVHLMIWLMIDQVGSISTFSTGS